MDELKNIKMVKDLARSEDKKGRQMLVVNWLMVMTPLKPVRAKGS